MAGSRSSLKDRISDVGWCAQKSLDLHNHGATCRRVSFVSDRRSIIHVRWCPAARDVKRISAFTRKGPRRLAHSREISQIRFRPRRHAGTSPSPVLTSAVCLILDHSKRSVSQSVRLRDLTGGESRILTNTSLPRLPVQSAIKPAGLLRWSAELIAFETKSASGRSMGWVNA